LKRYGYVTLCEYQLETGRTHQIRVHSKHLGHTIFNDPNYGGNKILRGTLFSKYQQFIDNCFNIMPRTALHAKSLGFIHPKTKEFMHFESELPTEFKEVLTKWDVYTKAKGYDFDGE
jgi:23S rRNA pseudouridine1911/1915/1917 synthase